MAEVPSQASGGPHRRTHRRRDVSRISIRGVRLSKTIRARLRAPTRSTGGATSAALGKPCKKRQEEHLFNMGFAGFGTYIDPLSDGVVEYAIVWVESIAVMIDESKQLPIGNAIAVSARVARHAVGLAGLLAAVFVAASDAAQTDGDVAPAITSFTANDRGDGGTYVIGDEIELTAVFYPLVGVTGTPQIMIAIDSIDTSIPTTIPGYATLDTATDSGSTMRLTFTYQVRRLRGFDQDADGIAVATDSVDLYGDSL